MQTTYRLFRCNGLLIAEVQAESLAIAVKLAHKLAHKQGLSLVGINLSGSNLSGIDLSGSDLSGSDLSGSNLSGSDLSGSDLSGSNLSGSDLSVPVIENIDRKILEAIEAGGRLEMNRWHTCGMTHCRGGWAITLADEAGAALARQVGIPAAASLIYAASRPTQRVPNFYAPAPNNQPRPSEREETMLRRCLGPHIARGKPKCSRVRLDRRTQRIRCRLLRNLFRAVMGNP